MISLNLIEFADLTRPQAIVNEILHQNPELPIPVPVPEIAAAAGINEIKHETMRGMEGALVANAEKTSGIIVVSQNARPHRQKFTIVHELGHFMIPSHGNRMSCSSADMKVAGAYSLTSSQRIEAEANQFSASLLMPQQPFQRHPDFDCEPSLEGIKRLASVFDVSFEACANRYTSLQAEPVAIVFSHNGRTRYVSKSNGFPFWIRTGQNDLVPPSSLTHVQRQASAETFTSDTLDADTWVDESRDYSLPEEIIELVYVMNDGYVVTLLYFENELEEFE